MYEHKLSTIPNFITAKSPLGLRRLMLLNNRKHSAFLKYDIQFVNGAWYAWYYADLFDVNNRDDQMLKEANESIVKSKD